MTKIFKILQRRKHLSMFLFVGLTLNWWKCFTPLTHGRHSNSRNCQLVVTFTGIDLSRGIVRTITWKLPRNWYKDTWFKSLPAGQQGKLDVMPFHPIPTPVHMYHHNTYGDQSSFTYRLNIHGKWDRWNHSWHPVGQLLGWLLGHLVAQEWPISYFWPAKSDFIFNFCLCTEIRLEIKIR